MKPQIPGTIVHPSPRKLNSKKETHRPPNKKHKLIPPPFFDTSSVYSDILSDGRWFDSSDDEEYVPGEGEGEEEEAEVEEIISDHEGEDDNEEEEDEFDDEYYESCSSEDDEYSGESDEESTVDPSVGEATPASTPAISTPLPETPSSTPLPETPSATPLPETPTPFVQEGNTTVGVEPSYVEDRAQSNSETDSDDVISKRTRAHHSLVDVELEELEKYLYLQTSPCGSPVEFDEPFRAVEYQNFLASLQIDDIDPVLLDDDNDADFDYVAELTQAKEIEEQDEYRNDRAVQVSKKEIDELMRGQELELAAIETANQQTKRRRKTRSATKEANQNRLCPLKTIRPFSEATRPSYVFTQPQRQQLQKQIADHAQLLLQIYLYARREQNATCTQQCWELLTDLSARRGEGMTAQALLLSASTPDELENSTEIENAKPSHVLFCTHVLDQMDILKQLVEADENPTIKSSEIIIEVFSETFNTELKLIPANQPAGSRLMFTPSEDSLLALGLEKHGANWDSIIKDYLPSKTAANIANRFKNMTARRAADNPIKAYKNARKIPLTPHEEILLQQGLRIHGDNWDLISKNFVPNRAGHVLKKNYDDMQKKRANEIAAASASAAALSKSIPIAPQPIAAVTTAAVTTVPVSKTAPVLTANPLPILPRPLVPLAPVPIPKLTPSQYNPQLTPVAVPVVVPNLPSTTSTATIPTSTTPAPLPASAPTTVAKVTKTNNSVRTVRVNINASGRRKRNDSDTTTSTNTSKSKSNTSNTYKIPLKPLKPNIPPNTAQTVIHRNMVNQNGVNQNGPPTPINEIFLQGDQPQITTTSYNSAPALNAPPTTYPYYPAVPQNQAIQEYDGGIYVPETNDINYINHMDLRSSTNSNESDEFEFEELDSDTEFDLDAMGDVEDAMAHPANLPPLTIVPLPPSSPTPSDPPFPFQSPHLPFTPNTPTTPSATNTPRTPLTSPLGALNIFSLDILSTLPTTPSVTPTKSAASTPTPTKMISPDRTVSPGKVIAAVTRSSPIAINLASKFISLPTSPNLTTSNTTRPLQLSQPAVPHSADLTAPSNFSTQSSMSMSEPSLTLLNLPLSPSTTVPPYDTVPNQPANLLANTQPSPTPNPPSNPPSDTPSYPSSDPTLVAAASTPVPKTLQTSHSDVQPTTSQLSNGQPSTGLSPPTVPVTPPTPTGTNDTTQQSVASVSVVPSSPTSTPPTTIIEKDISANNRVVLECGGTLVWSKQEDRAILLAAKSKQPTETFMDCWERQVLEGQLAKTPTQIEKRYEQLLHLMQLYNAKSDILLLVKWNCNTKKCNPLSPQKVV